jgi:hypothetical protein
MSALDSFFDAASRFPASEPGVRSVQIIVSVSALLNFPEANYSQQYNPAAGILLYTPTKEFHEKNTLLVEPAYFSGVIGTLTPFTYPYHGALLGTIDNVAITITAPQQAFRGDYNVLVTSSQPDGYLNGNFVPTALQMGPSCILTGFIPNPPSSSLQIVLMGPPTLIEF